MSATGTPLQLAKTARKSRIGITLAVACAGMLLTACSGGTAGSGGGGGSAASTSSLTTSGTQACSSTCGTALASITSSSSMDFLSYIVNVVSVSLTSADGAIVQTVPIDTQLDLTQLTNLSQILSASQVPAGRYTSVTLTLDYANATVIVNNGTANGVSIPGSELIDGQNNEALASPNATQMTVTLSLDGNGPFVVTPGIVANLALDFNLDASNTVSPSLSNPTSVTVSPVLTASLAPASTRQLQLGGALVSVNATAGTYVVSVRSYGAPASTAGQLTVSTGSATSYTINGTPYTGAAGLTALAALPAGALTQTDGTWDGSSNTFTATTVLAGSSVASAQQATVSGTVLARSGDTLTLSHAIVRGPQQAGLSFASQLAVTLGTGTSVSEQGQSGTFGMQDISVGQSLQLSGTLGGSSASPTLDASGGSAQLLITPLLGTVTSSGANEVTVALQSLAGLPPSAFTFTGTGASSAQDATATSYVVSVPSTLSTSGLSAGQVVGFQGFVTPFGSSPPDFAALTLTNYAQAPADLTVRWAAGNTAPFATLTGSQLQITTATLQAATLDSLRLAGASLNPAAVGTGLELAPNEAPTTQTPQVFAIAHRHSFEVNTYGSFNDLVTALTSDLNGTTGVLQLNASGPYDASTGVLTTDALIVTLND